MIKIIFQHKYRKKILKLQLNGILKNVEFFPFLQSKRLIQ